MLEYNLAAHVHPIYQPADGDGGQGGETFYQSNDLIVPADTSASGFYVLNPHNRFIGNAASGGWSGFAFPNAPLPINDHNGLVGDEWICFLFASQGLCTSFYVLIVVNL